ncbi:MAG: type II toxin-antitoxin system RelE/ParE family toxin [Firmicutes bacterium]|nr:type II toxin-antitoxin system RelE/ParE family toxin [Bacillota bacterium]
MKRLFVSTSIFDKDWEFLNLRDKELKLLQETILYDPKQAPVIQKTGGLRKMRFPLPNRGKSGSIRVIYADFEEFEITFLITVYAKNEMDNISEEQRVKLKRLYDELKNVLKGGRK